MIIKNKIMKKIVKIAILFAVLECSYLFIIPPLVNHFLPNDLIKNIVEQNSNANIEYSNIKFSTNITNNLIFSVKNINISDKDKTYKMLNAENLELKIGITDLFRKKINLKDIKSKKINLYIFQDKDGITNIEKLFPQKQKTTFKPIIKNNSLSISQYYITLEDKKTENKVIIAGNLNNADIKNKKELNLKTKGYTVHKNIKSDFDIDIKSSFPLSKNITPDMISGKCFIYNIDLESLFPYIKKLDKGAKKLSGTIDYLQISTNKDNGKNQISVNTLLKNIVYDRYNWSNNIHIDGDCKLSTHIEPQKNKINIKSLGINADKVDIKTFGNIILDGNEPELDLTVKVNKSRAENIFAMLPQDITYKLGTIEKIKKYGVYGDVEGQADIKGKIPQPDIIGFVKGRNVKVLDKSIQKLHTGKVDITFDKRKLFMDIFVELPNKQNAKVNGYTYMYRDGINDVNIKTTRNIDFPLAQKIIIPISKVFNFMLGPIVDMDITKGSGIIDLNVKGSIDTINMYGFSEFKNASLTYKGLYGKVEKASGRLDFKDDIIKFKSKQAFVKTNPLYVDGQVKINNNLDFNIISDNAKAQDVIEIINNSELLKEIKDGLAIFTSVEGPIKLNTNIKAKIVPVPFGQPPLPPDEAFEDMRVKGVVELFDDTAYIQGFKTPLNNINGIVNFTETNVDIKSISAISGTSNLTINGKVINDLKTKVPDVDLSITSDSVNLKDTIKFLAESYLYPENYPDISALYNVSSKHNLYFKYKAKSIDFLPDKAYAVINFIPDSQEDPLKAKSGKIVMENSTLTIDNVVSSVFDSNFFINGKINNIDTINPKYNLKIKAEDFNLANLNDFSKIAILPIQIKDKINLFRDYKGFADFDIDIKKNLLSGIINLKKPQLVHNNTNIPILFDDFSLSLNNDKLLLENITATIGDMPFFGNFSISDIYKKQKIEGFFSTKLTQNFVDQYLSANFAQKVKLKGDINLSANMSGTYGKFNISPKLTLQEASDISYEGNNIGDISEKREFHGNIDLVNKEIFIKNFEYIRYISSQNNRTYPIKFMNVSGKLTAKENIIVPEELSIKTHKNLPARFLNIMLKTPVLRQGSFNCDLKLKENKITKTPQIIGNLEFRNINIPLFDTVLKNIKIDADNDNINLAIFGFLQEERIGIKAQIKNELTSKPKIESFNVYARRIDSNKLFELMSNSHSAINKNNQIKNIDLTGLSIKNGHMEIKELIIKDLISKDFSADFSINEKGIFSAEKISSMIGEGKIIGKMSYDLVNTDLTGNFGFIDVDSNYIEEAIFGSKNQIFGNSSGRLYVQTKGSTDEERIKNLSGYIFCDIFDGRLPKLGSLEYLLRASNILKNGITGFTLNSILELLNLVKTGYFSNINASCNIRNGIAEDIEIFSKGENLSLYIHGSYDILNSHAELEILGKLSNRISTIFGTLGNTSLNTFFKLIPGISMFDFSRKNFIEDVEKIPSFTNGDYEAKIFQAIIDGDINESGYVQSFKWVK